MLTLSEAKIREIAELAKLSAHTDKTRFNEGDLPGIAPETIEDTGIQFSTHEDFIERFIDELNVPSLPEQKLRNILGALTKEEFCQIEALMWLGRNSFPDGEVIPNDEKFSNLYLEALRGHNEGSVEYVIGKIGILSEYLLRGFVVANMVERV